MSVRKRFCPKCGKPIESGVLCSDCSAETFKFEVPLIQVSEFNRVFHKGSWHHFSDLDLVIIKRIQEIVGKAVDVKIEPFEFIPKPKTKVMINTQIFLNDQWMDFPVKLSYMQCDYGQKEKTEYFEGILQIHNLHNGVLDYVDSELKKVSKKGVFITKVQETKNGVDLYFTNKTWMRLLGQRLVNKFGGELVLNPQLFSHNHTTSKDIYRLNVLVKLAPFSIGDIISFDRFSSRGKFLKKEFFKVTKVGRVIQGKDLVSNKQDAFEIKYIKNVKIIPLLSAQIISIKPFLVLDPETFQETSPKNSEFIKKELNIDDSISVIKTEEGIFVVE